MSDIVSEDFLQLVKIVQNMQQQINNLEQTNHVLIQSNRQLMEWVQDLIDELEVSRLRRRLRGIKNFGIHI